MKETFVDAQGAKLFCRTVGKGTPLIVLHGGPGLSQGYLLPQMERLAEHHFVIFYDQRGCGGSKGEISSETINMETYVDDLEAIRKAFALDKVSILGHSWGGFLAMSYAIAHPESVDNLILSNSVPVSSEEFALFTQEWIRRTASLQDAFAKIHSSDAFHAGDPDAIEPLHRMIFRTYCHNPESAELLNLRMPAQASVNGAQVYGLIRQNVLSHPFDLHESLKKLKIPTLILHGTADPVPASTAEATAASIQGSKYILMQDCGHFPYVEAPEEFFSYVNAFLNGGIL